MTSTMKPAKRILCVLLAFLMVFTACFMPMAKAAVVETLIAKYGVEILATILVASGIGFSSSDGARAAAAGCWNWISINAPAAVQEITNWVGVITGNPAVLLSSGVGVKFSQSFWDAIDGAVSALRAANGVFDASSPVFGSVSSDWYFNWPAALSSAFGHSFYLSNSRVVNGNRIGRCIYSDNPSMVYAYYSNGYINVIVPGDTGAFVASPYDSSATPLGVAADGMTIYGSTQIDYFAFNINLPLFSDAAKTNYLGSIPACPSGQFCTYFADILNSGLLLHDVYIPSSGDLVYPSDNYLVKMPDIPSVDVGEDGSEVVLYPDLSLNPADHLADIPKADVATGELVDVPTDVLVDVGTGELVQTGEGTGEGADTGLWDWLKSLLKSILDAIKSILAAIVGFFDTPADFRLDFDGFKNMRLPTRFPFCIPFDFVNAIRVFARNAQDFQFRIDLETSYFQIHHVVDLTPFILPIAFFRYTACIWFGLVLINKTRDLIKW